MFHLIHQPLPLIVMLLALLLAAKVLGEIFEHFSQPSMAGEVIAGVILGPAVLNVVSNTEELRVIADLGIFLLIAMAGMEINVEDIRNSIRGRHSWIAFMGFLLPFLSGVLIGLGFNLSYTLSLYIGLCLSITALTVTIRILIDLKQLESDIGQRMISAAIITDLAAFLVLGIILNFSDESRNLHDIIIATSLTTLKITLFIAILAVSYKLLMILKKHAGLILIKLEHILDFIHGRKAHFAVVILFILAFASIAEIMGVNLIIGAFFGAVLFPRKLFTPEQFKNTRETAENITMGFLAPIAFGYMGVSLIFTVQTNWWLLIIIIAFSFISKIGGGYLGGRMAGFSSAKSLAIGYGLNARGIMGLVIANVALQQHLTDASLYSILIMMALLTTLITPFLLKRAFIKIARQN